MSMVVLDYSMPGMDGKATFLELLKINEGAKVLFCSGYAEETIVRSFEEVRPAAFLKKPYKPRVLLDKVLALAGN
jgi:two-component system, cell cycle sensor histidine kinase and response regulator CckA